MKLTMLTPLELNKYRFSGHHTPLTPDQIEALHSATAPAPAASTDERSAK